MSKVITRAEYKKLPYFISVRLGNDKGINRFRTVAAARVAYANITAYSSNKIIRTNFKASVD